MLEIKVQCDCGQKYKFDVEPVDGRMPFVVNCPICGLNGTEKANEILSQVLPRQSVPATPELALAGAPAAAAAAPGAGSLTPGVPPGPTRLRINLHKPEPAAAALAPAATHAPAAPPPAPMAPRPVIRPQAAPAGAAQQVPGKKPSFPMGVLGGLIGSLVGSLIYFLIFKYADFQLKLMAIGVGYLAGAGAELLGRKEGSKELGVIAAVFTLVGIVGAQYFVALGWWRAGSEDLKPQKSAYEASVTEAKKVVAAIPTGSDQEIRIYMAKEEAKDSGEKIDPKSITPDEIKAFKETTLLEMQNLASGKLTKAEFEKQNGIDEEKAKKEADEDEGTFKAIFLLLLLNRLNLFSLCAAAALAFKVCSNA